MRKVSSDARGVDDIVKSELINVRACLQEKGEGLDPMSVCNRLIDNKPRGKYLANAARGTENSFEDIS